MPGPLGHRHELDQLAATSNDEVSGYSHRVDLGEIRMGGGIEPIGEKPLDGIAAEVSRRQADRVHDQQRYDGPARARVAVRRGHATRAGDPALRSWRRLPHEFQGAACDSAAA